MSLERKNQLRADFTVPKNDTPYSLSIKYDIPIEEVYRILKGE